MTPRDPTHTLPVSIDAGEQLAHFVAAVRASPHNLLSRRGVEELEERHVPECIGVAGLLPDDATSVLDVGTGGGFPGMVVAIVRSDLQVTLLDATSKKMAFLQEVAADMGVAVSTLVGRSEELVLRERRSFDAVTARAVAPLDRLLGWTLPWLRPGGLLYALKGERWQEELAAAAPVLDRSGAAVVDVTRPGVPVSTDHESCPDGVTPRVVIIRRPG